jgi:hypothetical protein
MNTYEQLTGRWLKDDVLLGYGYSGKGPDKNNPASEGKEGLGPIPCGHYKIVGPIYDDPKLGRDVLKLMPDIETAKRIVALGRDPWSFRLHGDSFTHPGAASDGCIIQPHDVRISAYNNIATDPDLEVVSGFENRDTDNSTQSTAV